MLSLFSNPLTRKALEYAGVALVVMLLVLWLRPAPEPIITQTTPNTVTVQVPVDRLVTKDVIKYVEDKENASRLMAENARLKIEVATLSETIAKSQVRGTGDVAEVPTESVPEILRPAEPTATVTRYKDWRLDFVHDGSTAKYELTQSFEVLSTTGHNEQNVPVTLVNLFELGPDGQRLPIPNVKTVTVAASPAKSRWRMGLTLQAGAGATFSSEGDATPGGVLGVQWLKRGRSGAAEDSTLAVLSPALFLSESSKEIGILPVSVNVAQKIPVFKDLWVSPFVGYNQASATKLGRLGIVFTASF